MRHPVAALLLAAFPFAAPAQAETALHSDPTVALLQRLLRRDTSNPPGRTRALAEDLGALLREAGLTVELIETPVPDKVHLVARLRGDGSKEPLLLAAHADVVPVDRPRWTVDPFAGEIVDGHVVGRGAIDFKGGLAVYAQALREIAASGTKLSRDVILLAEADEEGGPHGTTWLAEHHWDKIACAFALNEGGWFLADASGRARQIGVSVADKIYASVRLTTTGTATHSSRPRPDSAIVRLVHALDRVVAQDSDPELNALTRGYFASLAQSADKPELRDALQTLATSDDRAKLRAAGRVLETRGEFPELWHALMRTTVAPTILAAGIKENVIPGRAEAVVNLRLVPGRKIADAVERLRVLIADPMVQVELTGSRPPDQLARFHALAETATPSSTETPLFDALRAAAGATWPGAAVVPTLFEAGTDAGAWRSRGIPVYGIYPYPLDSDTLLRMHGDDERVRVQALIDGTRFVRRVVEEAAR